MDKEKIITRITDCGIVAVVRADSADQAKPVPQQPALRAVLLQSR